MVPFRSCLAALTALLLCSAPARAAEAETDALVRAWLEHQPKIRTWSAEFVQTRTLKALARPLTASGRVWFAAPNQFRWELGDPPQTIAVRRANEMLVIYPLLKRVERYPLDGSQPGQWRDALALLEAGFPRSQAELEGRFRIASQTIENGVVTLTLEPKSPSARRMMPAIRIGFGADDLVLRSTELHFADGSIMRNDFRKPELNIPLADGLFDPEPGPEFKVVEPLKK